MPKLIDEKELEDYLFSLAQAPSEEGSPIDASGKCFRQVNITGYGIIDLLYVDFEPSCSPKAYRLPFVHIKIVELKKEQIDLNAVGQICRYKVALERFMKNLRESLDFGYEITGVLVGSGYGSGDVCFVVDSCEWLSTYTYEIKLSEGLVFDISEGWHNTNENFSSLEKIKNELTREFIKTYKDDRRNIIQYRRSLNAE